MNEKEHDEQLRIRTRGTFEVIGQSAHYNRYEATPYKSLAALFEQYELHTSDKLVDFGCGRGRVSFYVNHRFSTSVTGVEMNGQLYEDALTNLVHYREKKKQFGGAIQFEHCLAETYDIELGDNRFYFFNPFSLQIFTKVITNILLSMEENRRPIDVILFYPTPDYVQYMENDTPFELHKEIPTCHKDIFDDDERFVIYSLQ